MTDIRFWPIATVCRPAEIGRFWTEADI